MPRIKTASNPKRVTYSQGGARGSTQLQRDGDFEFGNSQVNLDGALINDDAGEGDNMEEVDEEEEEEEEEGDDLIVLGGTRATGRVSITPGPTIRSRKRIRSSVTPIVADDVEKEEEIEVEVDEDEERFDDNDATTKVDESDESKIDNDDTGFRKRRSSKSKSKTKKKKAVTQKTSKQAPKEKPKKKGRGLVAAPPPLKSKTKTNMAMSVDDDKDNGVSIGRTALAAHDDVEEVVDLQSTSRAPVFKKTKRNPVEVPFGNVDRVTIALAAPLALSSVIIKTVPVERERSLPKVERGPTISSVSLPPPVDPRVAQKAKADAILIEERQRIPRFDLGVIIGRNKKLTAVSHGGRANLLSVAWVLGERIEGRRKDEVILKQIAGARWRDSQGKKQSPPSFGGAVSSVKLLEVFGAGNVLILKATDDLIHILTEAEHIPHPDFVSVFAETSGVKQTELHKLAVSTYSVGVRAQENEVCAPSILDLYIDANSSETTGSFEARKQLFHLKKVSSEEQVLQTSANFRFFLAAFHEQSRELYYALENRSDGESWSSTVSQARTVVKKAILQTFTDSRKGGPVSFEERAPAKKPGASRSMSKFAERKATSMARAALVDEVLGLKTSTNDAESSMSEALPSEKSQHGQPLNRGKSVSTSLVPTKNAPTISSKPADNIQSQWIDKFVLGSEDADEFKTTYTEEKSSSTYQSSHFLTSTFLTAVPRNHSTDALIQPSQSLLLPPPPPPPPPPPRPPQHRSQSQAAFRIKRLAEQKAKEEAELSEFDISALAILRESSVSVFSSSAKADAEQPAPPARIEPTVPVGVAKIRRFADLKPRLEKDRDAFDDI